MPLPIQTNDKKRNILIAGGCLLFAVVGFSIGRASSWLEAPITPPKVVTAPKAGGLDAVNVGGDSRVGGVFSSESSGKTGTAPTVGEITGGQPMEDWLKRVMAQEDELFRMQNFMKLLEAINSPEDIEAALKVIMAGGGRNRGPGGGARFTEISMLMSKYVQLDPKGAMAYSSKLEGGEKFMATSSALRTWTRLSPEAALLWAKTDGASITMDFGRGGPGGDQAEGAPKDNFALLSVVSQLAKTDLDKALSTASSMELGRFGDRMVDTLASEMIGQRGADAAKTYFDSLPAGAFRDQYLQQVADSLSKKDPAGTVPWIASKAESGDAKRRALGDAVGNWAKADLPAATAYVNSQPISPDMDSARGRILGDIAQKDAKAAWAQISTITDPERMNRTAYQVGRELVKADKDNAAAIIQGTQAQNQNLKPETVAGILNPRQGGQDAGQGGFGGFRNGGGGGGAPRPAGR